MHILYYRNICNIKINLRVATTLIAILEVIFKIHAFLFIAYCNLYNVYCTVHRSTGIPVPVPEEDFCSGSGEHF